MAELKRNFAQGMMNKDLDERLVPDGQYTDALNIQVSTSDNDDVGSVQTLRGNTRHDTVHLNGYYAINDSATVVGSIAAPHKDKIYYFVSDSNGTDIKRDYILEYDIDTGITKYVFVDIWRVSQTTSLASTSSDTFLYIPVATIDGVTNNNQNITGVRIGMKVEFGDFTLLDNIMVSDIQYEADTSGFGNDRYKVYLEQNGSAFTITGGLAADESVIFHGDRVLSFRAPNLINAINIIEDTIYWTDGESEPKRINITTSIKGTGGTEYLVGGGIAGYANADTTTTHETFNGDSPFFHTRLVQATGDVLIIDGVDFPVSTYEVVTKNDKQRAVYVDESHVTVIRKAPTQPLELDMFRRLEDRIPTGSSTANVSYTECLGQSFTTQDDSFIPILWQPGEEIDVTFIEPVDFRVGDILIWVLQEDSDNPSSFEDYQIRAVVTQSPVTDANNLGTGGGFTIEILSISNTLLSTDVDWFVRLEDTDPLFEFKFPRFSYRYKYKDGEYSTLAPWSQVAFLPGLFEYKAKKGYNLGMTNRIRRILLKGYVAQEERFPDDVVAVDLLYKETGNPTVYSVKTITPDDGYPAWPITDEGTVFAQDRGEYLMTTDLIHSVLPSNQIIRTYDNVPRSARAQEVSANRLVYGNYLQGYTVMKDPVFQVSYQQKELSDVLKGDGTFGADFAPPSVKSIRTYQVGVVFSDRYGRETPVLTASDSDGWATVHLPKDGSSTRNRLKAFLTNSSYIPSWAEYYTWYVKETSVEYYNLAMDRWYEAEDGNLWVSFPSSDRSKVDLETFLILKKAHGSDVVVEDKARYKILAIENEAPDYIKTEYDSMGILWNTEDVVGNPTRGYPLIDQRFILIDKAAFKAVWGETEFWMETPDQMMLRFYGQGRVSEKYEISKISDIDGTDYKIMIAGKFNDDLSLSTTNGADTYADRIDGLGVEIIRAEVRNRPEFDGRFFVKLARDHTLETHIMTHDGEVYVVANWGLRYINNNGYRNAYNTPEIPVDAKEWGSWTGDDSLPYQNSGGHFVGWFDPNTSQTLNTSDESVSKNRQGVYSDHDGYWWGGVTDGATVPSGDDHGGIKNKFMHGSPILSINDGQAGSLFASVLSGNTKADDYWLHMAGKQDFFIDACTAYSWNGRRYNQPGGYFGGNIFQSWFGADGVSDGWAQAFWADTDLLNADGDWDNIHNSGVAQMASDGVPGGNGQDTGNMQSQAGMPSRGIWNNGHCMDISWVGMGPGYDPTGDWNPPYPHKLQDVGGANYEAAWTFMSQLVEPGTLFRFQRDPDETVYTVGSFRNFPTYGYPTVPGSSNAFWKSDTTEQTGAYGIRNWASHKNAGNIIVWATAILGAVVTVASGGIGFWLGAAIAGIGALIGSAVDQDDHRKQYRGHNLRQRWTIMVTPAIGTVGSGYNPMKGTINGSENPVPPLRHDGFNQDVIEIVKPFVDPRGNANFAENPAIFETEPKEDVELDIYWQASGKNPLYLNKQTKEEIIPVGTVFHRTASPLPDDEPVYRVTGWSSDNTITFENVADGTTTLANALGQQPTFTKRDNYSFQCRTSNATTGDSTVTILGTRLDVNQNTAAKLWTKPHLLSWSNCYTFGNGVESDRIRDDFNAPQIDNGVKASAPISEPVIEERRKSSLIWSGVYNSVMKENNLNQFIAGEDITKDLNPLHGSIQALLNRETRLAIFCEDRILRAETNRDLLFNADGKEQVVASTAVVGDVVAYQGNYGIAGNPESLAATPYKAYFTDKNRNAVLMLTTEGITPIHSKGMTDYFNDIFDANVERCLGLFDDKKKEYNLTILKKLGNYPHAYQSTYFESTTIAWAEGSGGWTSFRSYLPEDGVSINNEFYTFYNGHLWKHHVEVDEDDNLVNRNNFYGTDYNSTINVPFNAAPQSVKTFNAISYEGSTARIVNFDTETTNNWLTGDYSVGDGLETNNMVTDGEYYNLGGPGADSAGTAGWYVDTISTNLQTTGNIEFKDREGKYYGYINGETTFFNDATDTNLDEHEFSVQGLGTATLTHSDPTLGEGGPIRVMNNNSNSYVGSDGVGVEWDPNTAASLTQNMPGGGWTISNAQIDVVLNVEEPAQVVNLTISPDTANGFYIHKGNFFVGGGAVQDPFYTWTGGNVDSPVSKIVFTDSEDNPPPSPFNTVNAAVHLDAFTPTDFSTIYVDIDGRADDLPSPTVDRHVCFNVGHGSVLASTGDPIPAAELDDSWQTAPGVGNTPTSPDGFTVTANNQDDNQGLEGSYQHSGTVQSDTTTVVATHTFAAATGYYYNTISVQTSLADYEPYYSWELTETYTGTQITGFVFTVSYTPPDPDLLPDPEVGGTFDLGSFCNLKHWFQINYNLLELESTGLDHEVRSVSVDPTAPHYGGSYPIIVRGKPNARYKISVIQGSSATDPTPGANGYFNWETNLFGALTQDNTYYEGTIGSDRKNTHYVMLPAVTSDVIYSVVISDNSVDGRGTLHSRVPTVIGDKTITQYGMRTFTLAPTTQTASEYGTLPANLVVTRPVRYYKDPYQSAKYKEYQYPTAATSSSSTRLVLAKRRDLDKIKIGQHVVGPGIAHGTTVVNRKENVVKLSAAATIAAVDTDIKFINKNSSVVPFSFTIVENGGGDNMSLTAGVDLETKIAGIFGSTVSYQTNGAVSSAKSITVDSTRGIIPGAKLYGIGVPENTTVSAVSSATVFTVNNDVDLTDDQRIVVDSDGSYSNRGVSIISMNAVKTGTSTTVVTITGYLKIDSIDNTITHPLYIDDIITV